MPRARNIKPGFFENEHLGVLLGDIQLLFIGLWTQSDREGVIEYRPGKLRKALFGFRPDMTLDVFNRYITVLEQVDNGSMLVKVLFQEKEYLVVVNFDEHQKPHHTEKKKKLPSRKTLLEAKKQDLTVKNPLENAKNPYRNALIPDSLIPDSLIPDSLIPENVIEKSRMQEILNQFDIFWQNYPTNGRNKGSKKDAEIKFRIAIKKSTFNEIMKGVNDYANYIQQSGQSNQDAFRWLEKERWKDDYTIGIKIEPKQRTADDNVTAGLILALRDHAEQQEH